MEPTKNTEIPFEFWKYSIRVWFRCVYRLNINLTLCRWKWNVFSQNKSKKNLSWRRYFIAATVDTEDRKFKTIHDQTQSICKSIFKLLISIQWLLHTVCSILDVIYRYIAVLIRSGQKWTVKSGRSKETKVAGHAIG